MDPLADFLDGPRARNAFLMQVRMSPPWSIKVKDDAPLTVVAMLRGSAHFRQGNGKPVQLEPGSLLLIRIRRPMSSRTFPAGSPLTSSE